MKRLENLTIRRTAAAGENTSGAPLSARHPRPSGRTLSRWLTPIALILSLICGQQAARAQDPGFSQFFASPLTLNPALTGKFNGVVRVAGNYRNQWPTINNAFITSTISVDAPILTGRLPENDTWGIGLMAMTD